LEKWRQEIWERLLGLGGQWAGGYIQRGARKQQTRENQKGLEYKCSESRDYLCHSLLHLQGLEEYLAHSRCLINAC
jgi:hypothetical protein